MPATNTNQDLTVRGGVINVPTPTVHHLPTRHRPNTPVRKLRTQQKTIKEPPPPPAADPPDPPETEPETVSEE